MVIRYGKGQCISIQFKSIWRCVKKVWHRCDLFYIASGLQKNQQETHPEKPFVPI